MPEPHREGAAIIGAGPAGLTAGYLLAKRGVPVTVLEAEPSHVGGNVRTMEYRGCRFDIGGYRFYSDSPRVNRFWREILPSDLLLRPRTSRIRYRGRFYSSPLRPVEALFKLGLPEAVACVGSWVKARIVPAREPGNFEEWARNRFGARLYAHFFKPYMEKTWGVDCREIPAEWALRRLAGTAFGASIRNAVATVSRPWPIFKTPPQSFLYPARGAGTLWETCARKMREMGATLEMGARVTQCAYDEREGVWTLRIRHGNGAESTLDAGHLVSTAPLGELVRMIVPRPSEAAARAATALRHRDLVLVALLLNDRGRIHDNWIYTPGAEVGVGRIQHYKASSSAMVCDPSLVAYGMEYFCIAGDGLWISRDETLVEMAERELIRLGLALPGETVGGCVVRQRNAFPIHDRQTGQPAAVIREEMARRYPRLHLIGRSGMHQCGRGDHPVQTAMRCVDEIAARAHVPRPAVAAEKISNPL